LAVELRRADKSGGNELPEALAAKHRIPDGD
jgi:hypothetical protein